MLYRLIILCILFFSGCRPPASVQNVSPSSAPAGKATETKTSSPASYPQEPGTCMLKGQIIKILTDTFADFPCNQYACFAKVIVESMDNCGFGVVQKPLNGDTILVHFLCTLSDTRTYKIPPDTRVPMPGLSVDERFGARIKIKLRPGDILSYTAEWYDKL